MRDGCHRSWRHKQGIVRFGRRSQALPQGTGHRAKQRFGQRADVGITLSFSRSRPDYFARKAVRFRIHASSWCGLSRGARGSRSTGKRAIKFANRARKAHQKLDSFATLRPESPPKLRHEFVAACLPFEGRDPLESGPANAKRPRLRGGRADDPDRSVAAAARPDQAETLLALDP